MPIERFYEIIDSAHRSSGHRGTKYLHKEISKKYANITMDCVKIYNSMCKSCKLKASKPKKHLTIRPILSKELNSRCQIDLIDMQSQPDNDYKFIMVYQDHLYIESTQIKESTRSCI